MLSSLPILFCFLSGICYFSEIRAFTLNSYQIRNEGDRLYHCNNLWPLASTNTGDGESNDSEQVVGTTSVSASVSPNDDIKKKKTVVVVGGGWAGFKAADEISKCYEQNNNDSSFQVELLDASPRGPGGLAAGWRTPKLNRPVEAGIHGFWREYKNTFATIEEIGFNLDDVLTSYTPSILVSQSGRVALAPVLGCSGDDNDENGGDEGVSNKNSPQSSPKSFPALDSALLSRLEKELPPPLDVALLSEFDNDNPLSIADRITALGLLGVWVDFEQESSDSWKRYDSISAENLFRSVAGISPTLYQELVSPLLHVLPMTPGYDCSAAAALSCFHVFALQSKGAFDVRWCRGTISEKIFNPWAEQLQSRGNVNIRGSAKVTAIKETAENELGDDDKKFSVTLAGGELIQCDAIVMAVGGTAMKRLLPSSPPLSNLPIAAGWRKFRGVTCVAVRLFLSASEKTSTGLPPSIATAMKDSPVVVCGPNIGNIPQLAETGFCIYDMQRLQDEFKLVSKETRKDGMENAVALEVDFFRADDIANMDDDMEVAKLTLRAVAAALNLKDTNVLRTCQLLDVSVVRARDAVSHFCVDSASWSPDVRLRDERGLYACGDWIDRTGHASWSTEKSVVTAKQAAFALAEDFGVKNDTSEVIPAASDIEQLAALRQAARLFRTVTPSNALPPAPWVLFKQLTGGRV